jgi:hypothetical protein
VVKEIERGYEQLYLCKPDSLQASYDKGQPPPRCNSPFKEVKALNVSRGWNRGLTSQFERVQRFQARGKFEPELVTIVESEED